MSVIGYKQREKDRMYSVKQAAAQLGVTDRHVRLLLATGAIPGRKLGHDWVVLSLEYERRRRPKTRREQTTDRKEDQNKEETWTEGGL
jgi:excisionase family DNA binding protein